VLVAPDVQHKSHVAASVMDFQHLIDRVPDLSDLELATLLCLVAKQHCIIETADELIDDLASELALVSPP
jgi:hypothetical protein